MKSCPITKLSLGCVLCLLTLLTGCIYIGSCAMQERYERTVQLSAPLSPGSTFAAETHNGSIILRGGEAAECNLTATIVGQATSQEDAQELAEATQVTLEPSGDKLIVKIDKPTLRMNQSVSVSLNGTVPNKTNLELLTHNGSVELVHITGQVNAATHNGKVTTEDVSGGFSLTTHNGDVRCTGMSGDAQLKTHNGSIRASYAQSAPSACEVSLVTYNGSIEFTAPPGFSAKVEAATHNGSVHTDLPITVVGKVSRNEIKGTIGAGQGKLHLETYNGSIQIKE